MNGLVCEQAGVWGGGNLLEKAEDVDRHEIMDYFKRGFVGLGGWDGRSSRPGRIYCCFSASVSYGCSPHNPRMYPSTGCYP